MQNLKSKKIIVGMSGGVDSSVAALILKQQGAEVVGLHMKNANSAEAEADERDVRAVCQKIGIDYKVVDFDDQMRVVQEYFISGYAAGRTPNPCVICNQLVKFKPFIDYAAQQNADYFATGHYANIVHDGEKHILMKAKDQAKDQSYFLNQLSQKQLEKALFPLGNLTKSEVRKLAEKHGLISANKKDSYDVCFVGTQKFKDYISKKVPQKSGDIVDITTGKVVGMHDGVLKYTIGQRKGLGIGGSKDGTGEGWFVVGKDVAKNIVYVSQGEGKCLLSSALIAKTFNFMPSVPDSREFECFAKFRYRQDDQPVTVKILDDGSVHVHFKEKQRAVTVGQFVVLYGHSEDGSSVCLGGGTIDQVIN